jgi:hypothetical protein
MRTEVHTYKPGEHCVTVRKGTRVYRVIGPKSSALEAAKLAVAFLLLGCGGAKDGFAMDLAECDFARTCAEAVSCRMDVAEKYGRPKTTVGHCQTVDGGGP